MLSDPEHWDETSTRRHRWPSGLPCCSRPHREQVWRHVQDEPIKLLELAQDDLASKSLRAYLRWVEAREQLDYPAAGLDS